MSDKLNKELEHLVMLVRRHPDGISIQGLQQGLHNATPKRTVQYRLSRLVKSGILRIEGAGRNSRYHFNQDGEQPQILEIRSVNETAFMLHLSPKAEQVRKSISLPQPLRRHASYRREFLEAHQPNKTFYLSQSIIK